jgi:hypothetical protein
VRVVQEPPTASVKPWSDGYAATYWLGRATTEADGNVLHEAHPVYRREDSGRPQLVPPPAMLYPTHAPGPSTNAAFEQFEVLRAEVARARELILRLARASEELVQQTASLKTATASIQQVEAQLRQLLQNTAAFSNRLQQLEQRLTTPAPPLKP